MDFKLQEYWGNVNFNVGHTYIDLEQLFSFARSLLMSNINSECFVSHICDAGHAPKEETET